MTDYEREEKQREQILAIDEARSYLPGTNKTFRCHLLSMLDLKDIVFAHAGCLIANYNWLGAEEELEIISCMAMMESQRTLAMQALAELRKVWEYLGGQLHPESTEAKIALEAGRFDCYTKIIA